MDLPNAPRDTGLRNIIDKLAEFVARNGPEFESITKAKQKGNPKFEFLYGGELYNYYQYRVASEQAFLKQQASISQAQHHNQSSSSSSVGLQHGGSSTHVSPASSMAYVPTAPSMAYVPPAPSMSMNQQHSPSMQMNQQQTFWHNGPNGNMPSSTVASEIEAINMQQNTLRDQIRQSEQNLSAQHGVLIQQQQKQIDESIHKAQNDTLHKLAEDHNVYLAEFDAALQPIIESCTKDSISAGKNWILQHTSDTAKCNVVLQYLLKKALINGASFTQKLHLIYLVNDVLHHCVRKNANDLKSCLENVVIPMFCSAEMIATDEQKAKLCKLLSLWESKAKFFDACVISKLRSPESSMQEYKTNLMNIHNNVISKYTQATKAALDSYQHQHQIFIQHAAQQITVLETQKQTLEQQVLSQVMPNANLIPPLMDPQQLSSANMNSCSILGNSVPSNVSSNISSQMNSMQVPSNTNPPAPQPLMAQKISMPTEVMESFGSPGSISNQSKNNTNPFSTMSNGSNNTTQYASQLPSSHPYAQLFINSGSNSSGGYASPPPAPSFKIPDLSKPPPGFSSGQGVSEDDVKPTVPYYELPAGLMVPLIRLEDYEYKPLDPNDVRLPPPAPQSERLSSAIVAFYSLPSHDRPRDVEGWEKLALYEYYKVKNAARKQKEEELQSGEREKSRSPTPIEVEPVKPKKPNKRCYRSKSRSRSRSKSLSVSPPRRSRSRSPPPVERNRNTNRYSSNRRSPKRSPIRDRERDRERERGTDRERERERQRERDRPEKERDRPEKERDNPEKERERSASPPSFFAGTYPKTAEFIEETNKGHQMLMKMGWAGSGTGLGSKGQGIDAPISGGEVRDRKDMYKGIGINLNDPYENFRKNKGAAFIHRMRSRAEEKS